MAPFSPTDLQAILLSLRVACTATIISIPLGIAAAWLVLRLPLRWRLPLELCYNLPLTLPPVTVGYLLLLILGPAGYLGRLTGALGVSILFTWRAGVVASLVVGFPLLVRSIRVAMESIDPELLLAARSLGSGSWDRLWSVVIPLSWRGILVGATLMFARSLGEFGATIVVAGNIPGVTQTLPLAIYDYAMSPQGDRQALLLCLVSLVLSVLVLAVHEGLVRRMGRG